MATNADPLDFTDGECREVNKVSPFSEDEVARMVAEVRTWHDQYTHAGGDLKANIRARNAKIRGLFSSVAYHREEVYSAYRLTCRKSRKCSSSTGHAAHCPETLEFPDGMGILQKGKVFGTGHRITPRVRDLRFLDFEIGKAGAGSNEGGVEATAIWRWQTRAKLVQAEMDIVRRRLARFGLPDDRAIDPVTPPFQDEKLADETETDWDGEVLVSSELPEAAGDVPLEVGQ